MLVCESLRDFKIVVFFPMIVGTADVLSLKLSYAVNYCQL